MKKLKIKNKFYNYANMQFLIFTHNKFIKYHCYKKDYERFIHYFINIYKTAI